MTSHDVVARVRRLAGTRKVGHAGTLDPMATGVLVLGVNRATRLLGHLMLTDKAYDATMRLGATTTTDDAEGEVVATASTDGVDRGSRSARPWPGSSARSTRCPSAVSAIKVDGRRAYDRVRAGEQVELAAAPRCGSTRSRCTTVRRRRRRRLGAVLERHLHPGHRPRPGGAPRVGGHLTALRRTAVGPFALDAARTLEQLEDELVVLPIGEAARQAFPSLDLDEDAGRPTSASAAS